MTLTASGTAGVYAQTSKEIDMPTGLNKNNCIVLSIGTRFQSDSALPYVYGRINPSSTVQAMVLGNAPFAVALGNRENNPNKILLYGYNPSTSAGTVYYKIVLMRII